MVEKLVYIEKKQLKYKALEVESEIELSLSSRDTCHEDGSSIVANSACMSFARKLCGCYLSWVVVVAEKRNGGASEHASGCLMGNEGESGPASSHQDQARTKPYPQFLKHHQAHHHFCSH
jgi:hypothetical protein